MTRVREVGTEPKRVPLSEQKKSLMTVPEKPGFKRRWVNDNEQGQRVAAFLRAGWRIVEDTVQVGVEGVVSQNQTVGSGARKYVGAGVMAILMEIEEKYFNEDQAAKAARIDEVERAIYGGEEVDGHYGSIDAEDRYQVPTKRR